MANGFTLTANLNVTLPGNLNSVVSQLNSKLKGVNVNVGVNLANGAINQLGQLNSQIANVGKQARSTATDYDKFSNSVASSLKKFTGFTIIATTFYTLSRAIRGSIDDAIDFQNELVKISQVTGTALKDLKGLSDEVTQLSVRFGVNSNKLLNAAQVLAQAGLSAEKTKVALEALAKTDVSPTFDNIADTTEGVIAIMAQFGTEAEELEGTLGSLNAVAGKFAVESSDIITAVRRTGGAFKAAGGDLNQLIALFTSVRQTTRESAESIATGFRTIFTRIQRTRTIGFLDDLGIQLRDLEGKFIGPYAAIGKLSEALKDLDTTDPRFAQIIEELGGFRQVSKVIPLIKEFGTATQALRVAQLGQTSLTEDAAKSSESLSRQIAKVREEFQALIRSFGEENAIKGFISGTLELASAAIKLADALKPLLPLLGAFGAVAASKILIGGGLGIKKAIGFNRGGLVPGSGSGDTVPAMLEPGEYVLRKNAVQAMGVGNVANMNRKRFAHGGGSGDGIRQRLATADDIEVGSEEYKRLEAKYLASSVSAQTKNKYQLLNPQARAIKLFAIYKDEIQNRITPGITRDTILSSAAATKEQNKADSLSLSDQLIPQNQRTFGVVYAHAEGFESNKDGFTNITYGDKNIKVPYNLKSVGIPTETGNKLRTDFFAPNIKKGIQAGAESMRGFFGARDVKKPIIQNEDGIIGSMFESSLIALGAPYDAKKDFDGRTFDFRQGLGPLAQHFGPTGTALEFRPTDAKLNKTESNDSKLTGKINTYYQDLVNPKGISRKAAGGNTTDSIPALLTPGEYVINRDAARAIGLGELNRMNKADKVQKFARGGAVNNVANLGGLGFAVLPLVVSSLDGLTGSNKELINTISSIGVQFATFNILLSQVKNSFSSFDFGGKADDSRTKVAEFTSELQKTNDQLAITSRDRAAANRTLTKLEKRDASLLRDIAYSKDILQTPSQIANARKTISNPNATPGELSAAQFIILNKKQPNPGELANARKSVVDSTRQRNVLQPSIILQQGLIKSQAENIVALDTSRQSIEARIEAENQNIASMQKWDKIMQGSQIATALVSAGLISVGQALQNSGLTQIKAGNFASGRSSLIAGGRTQGAGQGFGFSGGAATIAGGAAIGTGVAPGVGTIVGGLIGAGLVAVATITGFKIGEAAAIKMADDLERQVKFDKAIKPFERSLEAVLSGKIQTKTGAFNINQGSNLLLRNLQQSSAEGKESAQGKITEATLKLSSFLNKVASESSTFEEFEKSAGDVLTNFRIFSGIPIDEINKEYRDQIALQTKANNIQHNANAAQERQIQRLREFNSLTSSLKDTILAFDTLSVSLESIESFASGGSGSTKFVNRSEIFDRIGSISSTSQLEQITGQVAGSIGPDSSILRTELLAVNSIAQKLPNLLAQVAAESPNDGEALGRRFEEALQGQPAFLKQILRSNLDTLLGPEQKDEKFFSGLRDNANATANKLLEGSAKDIAAFFKEQAQLINDHNNKIAGILEKQRSLQSQFIELEQKRLNISDEREEFNRSLTNSQLTLDEAQNIDDTRRGSFGVRGPFGLNTVDANGAAEAIIRLQQSITENEVRLQKAEAGEKDKLLKSIADERNQIDRLNKFLGFLGDAAQRNGNLLKVQAQFQQERQVRRGIAENFIFGGPEARRNTIVGAAGAAQLARTNNISSLPEFAQSETFSFLKNLGDVKLGILGNKSGEDVIKATITDFLKKSGLNEREAQEVAGLSVSRPEQLVVDAINQKFNEATEVAKAQGKIFENIRDLLQKQSDNATKVFDTERSRLQNESKINTINQESKTLEAKNSKLFSELGSINKANSILAPLGVKGSDVFSNFETLQKLREQQEASKGLRVRSSFSSKFLDTLEATQTVQPTLDNSIFQGISSAIPVVGKDVRALKENGPRIVSSLAINQLTGNKTFGDDFVKDSKLDKKERETLFQGIEQKFGAKFAEQLQSSINTKGQFDKTDNSLSLTEFNRSLNDSLKEIFKKNESEFKSINEGQVKFSETIGTNLNGLRDLFGLVDTLKPIFANINTFDTVKLQSSIDSNTKAIQNLETSLLGIKIPGFADNQPPQGQYLRPIDFNDLTPKRLASGGKIPGSGNSDNVRALLTPGEFVLNKQAANAIGDENLFAMNRMARGGSPRLSYRQRVANFRNSPQFAAQIQSRKDARVAYREKSNRLAKERNVRSSPTNQRIVGGIVGNVAQGFFGISNKLNEAAAAASLPGQFADAEIHGRDTSSIEGWMQYYKNKGYSFADGGVVPGRGNTDSIPALLMPGEFVMNKAAVQSIGVQKLDKANRSGRKKMAEGGLVNLNYQSSNNVQNLQGIETLKECFTKFDASVAKLATALESMPHTISIVGRHTVEVIFNGAEVLKTLEPSIQTLVVKKTEQAINSMLRDKFPDAGTVQ